MARRASSKIRPFWVAVLLGVLATAIGLGVFLQSHGGDPYRTDPELTIADYLTNANSLRGNIYKVKGVIHQSLGYSRAKGRLFSVEVAGGPDGEILPVLVPTDLSYLNLQKGQHYTFRLEVGEGGVLRALDMKKG